MNMDPGTMFGMFKGLNKKIAPVAGRNKAIIDSDRMD
jgi:hypothetical protein